MIPSDPSGFAAAAAAAAGSSLPPLRPTPPQGARDDRMTLPQGNGRNESEALQDADTEEARINEGLDKLWKLCNVLGIHYKKKFAEFGKVVTEERVQASLNFLTVTRDANFKKLKELSKKMTQAWESFDTNLAKVESFSWILLIRDAEEAEEVVHWNLLSTDSLEKADKEVCRLIKEREQQMLRKYNMKRSKLRKMLADAHLTSDDFEFDMNQKVTAEDYRYQKAEIEDLIKVVKKASGKRKEMVLRIEMARRAMRNKTMSVDDLKAMISYAENAAQRLESNGGSTQYEGQTVEDVLMALHDEVQRLVDVQTGGATEALSRTRSGRTVRVE